MTARQDDDLGPLVAALSRPGWFGQALGRLLARGQAGRLASRLMRAPVRAGRTMTAVTRLHARLLVLARGRARRSWLFAAGQPVLALTTVGRRSGEARTTAVAALSHGRSLATVGMNLGSEHDPAWSLNLRASPDAWITVAGRTIPVRARLAEGGEREQLWHRWLELQPSAAAFAALAGRQIPVFVLERR